MGIGTICGLHKDDHSTTMNHRSNNKFAFTFDEQFPNDTYTRWLLSIRQYVLQLISSIVPKSNSCYDSNIFLKMCLYTLIYSSLLNPTPAEWLNFLLRPHHSTVVVVNWHFITWSMANCFCKNMDGICSTWPVCVRSLRLKASNLLLSKTLQNQSRPSKSNSINFL